MTKIEKRESIWRGYKRLDFEFNGYNSVVVFPNNKTSATIKGKWVWRNEFFTAFDTADMMMLERGYYLLHYEISDMYGCDKAISLMKNFYDYVTREFALSDKTIFIGLSRGGLYAVNFTIKFPSFVSAIYLDAAVLDLSSWPQINAQVQWEECKKCYGVDEIKYSKKNPINNINKLMDNNIPIMVVAGDADQTVPFEQNSKVLIDAYVTNNKPIKYIIKSGCDHHPHSLEDATPICDYLCQF